MAKLVILKFGGDFQSGFQADLEIRREGQAPDLGFVGKLPPALKLSRALAEWQQQYMRLDNNSRIKPQQVIYDGSLDPQKQLLTSAKKLQQEFQQWLDSPSFYPINKHLREELQPSETIRLLVSSDRQEIYQLPWCCWDLVDNYPNLEIAISNFDFKRVAIEPTRRKHRQVRILAILGDSQNLNLNADCNFLDSLQTGKVVFLKEPTPQELYFHLWSKTWDIVFFAGHSKTIEKQGLIYINQTDRLTIEELKHAFKRAIANGLQLAIFNSCDGLGIARELGKLFLPQSIVMRMPIPDVMAQEFIKHFLHAYAGGNSLYLATKMARQQLQAREKQYPCASWLPIIYQNPAVIPCDWKDLYLHKKSPFPLPKLNSEPQPFVSQLLATALALILVCLIQSWGWLEAAELNAYDRFIAYRVTPPVDERILVITISDLDLQYQQERGMAAKMRGSLSDLALNQTIDKLRSAGAKAIASDVIHDFPFEPELKSNIAQSDDFFAICRIKIDRQNLLSISAPPSLPVEQVGFSNWARDDDGAIRRQIMGMSPDGVCQSSVSLSLRLAIKYLNNIPAKYEQHGVLQIGSTTFPRLKPTSGGYHLPEAHGYQTLLNYRHALPKTIALRDALTMEDASLASLVRDKIVLIGVVGYNQDLHHTPYSQGKEARRLPGVIIHAQMTSYIVSAVLGEQQPLRWFCDRWEILWIGFWCAIGSVIVTSNRASPSRVFCFTIVALAIIFGCSWLLFVNNIWLIAIAPCWGLLLSAAIVRLTTRISSTYLQ